MTIASASAEGAFASRRLAAIVYIVLCGGFMIGAAGSSPSLTSQMYQKMFAQVDKNADGAVSLDELVAMRMPEPEKEDPEVSDVFKALDRNGDGALQSNEFAADKLFDSGSLSAMLSAQEYRDADPKTQAAANELAVAALFERADINGDGLLDQAEMDAEKALRRAETLDTGKLPEIAYLTRVTEDGKLSPEDIVVGRMLPMDALKAVDLTAEQSARFEHIKEVIDQNAASEGAKPGRTLDDLRAEVQQELDTKLFSTEMIARLFARLSADAFSRASPVDQSA